MGEIVTPTNCEDCCACCLHMGHPTFFMMPGYVEKHWENLPVELKAVVMKRMDGPDDYGEACIWLDQDAKRCRHYEHRPQVCRDFKVGGKGCSLVREKVMGKQTAAISPKIDKN